MILRRYGESFHSVEPNFDPRAMNEVGFRRDRAFSIAVEELSESYEAGEAHDLVAEAEGPVQTEAEATVLVALEAQLKALVEGLGEEIKMTTRLVNALDEMIIPEIMHKIRRISTVLEEREREDIYRLKRFKKRKA